jgi:GntR family transcriptional regulator
MVDHNSPLPLYFQLARDIQEMIDSGELERGERVPSEISLSESYRIGRPTVRQALDLLQRKGLVLKRKGSGTFVREVPKAVSLFSLAGTSAAFMREGIKVKRNLIRELELIVPEDISNPLKGLKVYHLSRLNTVEGSPVLLEEIFMNSDIFKGIEKFDLGKNSLSAVIENEFYMKPEGGRQSFGVKLCRPGEAILLGLGRNKPVLWVKRELYFRQNRKAFYSEILCRTDKFVFYQDLGEQGEIYE